MNQFTLADALFFPQLAFVVRSGYPLEKLPKLSKIYTICWAFAVTKYIIFKKSKLIFFQTPIMKMSASDRRRRKAGHHIGKRRPI